MCAWPWRTSALFKGFTSLRTECGNIKKCVKVTSWKSTIRFYARSSCFPSLICTLKEILVEKVAVQVILWFSFWISLLLVLNLRKIADVRCRKLQSWKLHAHLRPKNCRTRWGYAILSWVCRNKQSAIEQPKRITSATSSVIYFSCSEFSRYGENCILVPGATNIFFNPSTNQHQQPPWWCE